MDLESVFQVEEARYEVLTSLVRRSPNRMIFDQLHLILEVIPWTFFLLPIIHFQVAIDIIPIQQIQRLILFTFPTPAPIPQNKLQQGIGCPRYYSEALKIFRLLDLRILLAFSL